MTEQGGFKKPVKVVIDGREIVAEAGEPLLQVALDNGVEIPHYGYHPKLSIDGSCRMCQVKIEKAPKLAISCNTPVTDGMVVDTKAPEVVEVRKAVMELLLLNHPLDCPICDQAGECYLQDYSFGHGREHSRATAPRRKGLKRHPIGPRVVFDQERCILCRRCVRFTKEISKTDELRVFGAGDRSRIATSAGKPLDNDYSINTADICPVGALLSSDFHHKRRVWFLEDTESVCPSCSNGCNVRISTFRNEIQRLLPRRNDEVNDTWMCDHGRLRYAFVHDETRLRAPAIANRPNGGAVPTVDEAIAAAAAALRAAIATYGAQSVAVVLS
ncbi:MAG: 2Fe-2S iron-sulfur cluster-binding protein, partial [Alphaproteobacteria bacterium]